MVVSQRACNPRRLQLPVPTLEHVAVTLRKDTVPINMVAIYRPQTVPMPLLQSCLEKLVKSLPANQPAVILDDFIIDIYQNSQHAIINLMEDLGFRQHVTEPTTDSGSLLDHVAKWLLINYGKNSRTGRNKILTKIYDVLTVG